jgi:hypothetical protein
VVPLHVIVVEPQVAMHMLRDGVHMNDGQLVHDPPSRGPVPPSLGPASEPASLGPASEPASLGPASEPASLGPASEPLSKIGTPPSMQSGGGV